MADEVRVKERLPLTNGAGSIPAVGIGTFNLFGQMGADEDVAKAVKSAIEAGYRHIDCAWVYQNETYVGEAIQSCISAGTVKREDIFITTKLWDAHHHPIDVKVALKDSLKKLQTDYVDMFLIHWPVSLEAEHGDLVWRDIPKDKDGNTLFAFHKLEDTWEAMEECVREGLTKNIGLSNFNARQVERIMTSCKLKPSNAQIEISPYFSNKRLTDFCKARGMVVTAYAPLGNTGRPWLEDGDPSPFEEQILKDIATAKGRTIAQVILRFHLQNGLAVVPKSVSTSRVRENFQVFDFTLSEDEMTRIASLDRNLRIYKEPFAIGHPEYPFDDEF